MYDKKVAVIDYGMGNIYSICNTLKKMGVKYSVINKPEELLASDCAILPGVGAYPDAMEKIIQLGLDKAIIEFVEKEKPILGICLGMQLLCNSSSENGNSIGLSLIDAVVEKFPDTVGYTIPQIQWNKISSRSGKDSILLEDIEEEQFFYFLHSYYVKPNIIDSFDVLLNSTYCGMEYCSGFESDNIFATQFHPEKSSEAGHKIISNFLRFGGCL